MGKGVTLFLAHNKAIAVSLVALLIFASQAKAQFRSYATQPSAPAGRTVQYGGGTVYPEFRNRAGSIRWIKDQMPLKVYVSNGRAVDGFIDPDLGATYFNVNNLDLWPDYIAQILDDPEKLNQLPQAEGFVPEHYQAVLQGINMWKPFEKEGLFSYQLTNDPQDADIYVFFVNHFVDKLGLGLFAGDIRGYTAKRCFPLKAIMAGGHASFKPVLIMLRTIDSTGVPMPFNKMKASAGHEFGHALGIDGHSTNTNDLMSGYYGRGVLSTNDAATIRYLYHLTPDLIP